MPDSSPSAGFALPTTFPRYVFAELAKALLLCLAVFSLILMASFAGQVLMKDGVGLVPLLWILPNLFPIICPFVMPLAVTTAILVCYGRLSAGNEYFVLLNLFRQKSTP